MNNKPIKVLVVEDSEDDTKLAMLMLRRGGFQPNYRRVQDASSLREAIAEKQWDLVLSDFRLPGFTGVEALHIFRESGLDVPFIFVSGTIGEEVAVEAMKAGASDYVMKQNLNRLAPVVERELMQAVIRAQHRQAQIDLEASHARYVDLYEFAPVGYLTLSEDGSIDQLNLTGADMLGEPREQLLGRRFARFVVAEDAERWFEHFMHALHEGRKLRLELLLQRMAGTRFHAQLDCMRMTGQGALPMVRVAIIDVSDRKAAEADLRKYELQLRHAQKMESVGTLAGGIAHDFNNILGAILGNAALAREELGPGHPALRSLDEIQRAGLRARNLVRQILTFSRREVQQLLVQPLGPIVEETHELLRATLPAGVDFTVTLPDKTLHVLADATQIQQVLMNLVTNAWHALRGGSGQIVVGLEPVQVNEPAATRLGLQCGEHAHLWVRDSGSGMDAATRERIFEPFFTTKPVGQGTGLGLSVVHGILAAHRGAIEVESEPGRGSCFHLYLPAAPAPAQPAQPDHAPEAAVSGHGERLMVLDDDETMLLMVTRLLERQGYRVTAFRDAQQALAAVRDAPQAFDCVLTDFNMPGCSGLDIARELARIRPGLPVVISSGYITDELSAAARQWGVRALVEKQNTFEELAPLMAQVLAQAPEAGR